MIKGYMRYTNRFRSVGMKAGLNTGSWDQKVEHLVVDLFDVPRELGLFRVFIIKVNICFAPYVIF